MSKQLKLFIAGWIFSLGVFAQVPTPAPDQSAPIAIVNGRVHVGNGEVIENAAILFADGVITSVTKAADADLSGYTQIDATGKDIYPGLISPVITLGLAEVSAVRATIDDDEVGDFIPNVRSIIAYNTDSEVIPTMKFNGIQIAQVTPAGGRISGSSSIVQLDAWNWRDAIYKEDDGVHLNWPSLTYGPRWWQGETERRANEDYQKEVDEVINFMKDAKSYAEINPKSANLKLEATRGLFSGDKKLFVSANRVEQIIEAINVLTELGIPNMVLVGAEDAWYARDLIKENNIPVLLSDVHRRPDREGEDIDLPYKLPGMLHNAGIKVGLTYTALRSARNLAFYAGTAAAYGITKEEALAMVTSNTAEILGIADRTGTLEQGKDANIVVSSGDLLDMRTNKVEYSFIQGRQVKLDGLQQRLYEKYKNKYEEQD